MRIAVWHNLVFGGGARALQYHLQGLVKQGHTIEIWSPDPLINGYIKLPEEVKVHKIHLERNTHTPYTDRIKSVLFCKDGNIKAMERHCQLCADEINQGSFDVLFANSCYYYAAPFICRFVKIPSVLYLGEPYRFFFESHPRSIWEPPASVINKAKLSKSFYWEWCKDIWKTTKARVQLHEERINIEAAGKLLLNSWYSTESCARAYDKPGEVCYLGVDTSIFKPTSTRKIENYIISVGALYFHKNPELAIRAISLIQHDRPKLVWVANLIDAEFCEKTRELAKSLGVDFEVKEMISDDELVQLLSNALCMLYTARLEPFGFAPLEASACQTPVIGLRQGGVKEIVYDGETGFLCSSSAWEISEKIKYLMDNPAERDRMGRCALETVLQKWTLHAATCRIEEALFTSIQRPSNLTANVELSF
jgi:glycosyltransferase involved in cell wall biosynthesis